MLSLGIVFPSRNNQYKDNAQTKPNTILPTSPKNIFAGFQFQYKKAKQVDIIKISNDGKYLIFSSNRNNGGNRDTNIFIAEWQD